MYNYGENDSDLENGPCRNYQWISFALEKIGFWKVQQSGWHFTVWLFWQLDLSLTFGDSKVQSFIKFYKRTIFNSKWKQNNAQTELQKNKSISKIEFKILKSNIVFKTIGLWNGV